MHILIVEDDDLLREIYVEKLVDDFDFEVLTARTGHEGIKICSQVSDIDLIISDINMPDGTGQDLLKYLEKYDYNIPLVFFSSNLDPIIETSYEPFLGIIDKNQFSLLSSLIRSQIEA